PCFIIVLCRCPCKSNFATFSHRCINIVIVSKRNGRKSRNRFVVAIVAPLASCSSRPVPSPRSFIRSARERVFSVRYR
ncbi:MAG: hypothetical protein ACK55Z_25750, partial [bacterium]